MAKAGALYDRDFVLWTEEQAAALRGAKASNLPLDWENLAEEIESLGKSDRRALASQMRRILHHLLKMQASTATEPRVGWRSTIRNARAEIEDILRDSPSLRPQIDTTIAEQLGIAAKLAEDDLAQYGEAAGGIRPRLQSGRFTAEQVLGDWFPEPPG
jgi:Domain of unknown function DUF29